MHEETTVGTHSIFRTGRSKGGEHVWRDREGEGLIKAEFFEQRRRITTRRMPVSFKRNGAA